METTQATVDLRRSESPAETYAFALVVFSIVPYLGILFSLPAMAVAAISIFSDRKTKNNARTYSMILITSSFAILLVQFILWALLYYPPAVS